MKCTHPQDHESIKQCTLKFGPCWNVQNRPARDKKTSNIPSGVWKPDMDSRSFLK